MWTRGGVFEVVRVKTPGAFALRQHVRQQPINKQTKRKNEHEKRKNITKNDNSNKNKENKTK